MEHQKRVLIITYYWPPAGGSGVQRHLKFVKYLRSFGWEPIVFTVKNGSYPEVDHSLEKDIPPNVKVLKAVAPGPYTLFKALTGNRYKVDANLFHKKNNNGQERWSDKLFFWIRSNFFIPDARVFWAIPSIIELRKFFRTTKVDAIVSTGPPHTAHIIANNLSRKFNIPWLADFRDGWTKNDYFEKLNLSYIARKIHERWEYRVLTAANCVVTVSPYHANELKKIAKRSVHVITNGFDEDDFPSTPTVVDEKFTIVHTGMLSGARNHPVFWEALAELAQENPEFSDLLEIHFYGNTDPSVVNDIPPTLANHVFIHDYTDHREIPAIQRKAHVLYLPIHHCAVDAGFLPGKLYEYLAARRPILSIGPDDGDTAHLLRELKVGESFSYQDKEALKKYFSDRFHAFKKNIPFEVNTDILRFSRRRLTGQLATLLDQISNHSSIHHDF